MDKNAVVVLVFLLQGIVALAPTNENLARMIANHKRLLVDFSSSLGDALPKVTDRKTKSTKSTSSFPSQLQQGSALKSEKVVSDDIFPAAYELPPPIQPKIPDGLAGQTTGNSEFIFGSSLPSLPGSQGKGALKGSNPSSSQGSIEPQNEYVFGAELKTVAQNTIPVNSEKTPEVSKFGRAFDIFAQDSNPPTSQRKQEILPLMGPLDMFSPQSKFENSGIMRGIKPDKPPSVVPVTDAAKHTADVPPSSSSLINENTLPNTNQKTQVTERSRQISRTSKNAQSGRVSNVQVDLSGQFKNPTKPGSQSVFASQTGHSNPNPLQMANMRQPTFLREQRFPPFPDYREMIPIMFNPRTRTFSPMMSDIPMMEVRDRPRFFQHFPGHPMFPPVLQSQEGPSVQPDQLPMHPQGATGFPFMDTGAQISPMEIPNPDFFGPQGPQPISIPTFAEMPFTQTSANKSSKPVLPTQKLLNNSQTTNATNSAIQNRMAMMERHRQMYLCYKETPRAVQTVCALKQDTSSPRTPCALNMVCVEMQPGVGKCCARDRQHANMLEDYVEMNYPEHLH